MQGALQTEHFFRDSAHSIDITRLQGAELPRLSVHACTWFSLGSVAVGNVLIYLQEEKDMHA
jgi:hypothetical protein